MADQPEPSDDGVQQHLPGLPGGPPTEPDQTMAMGVANIGFMLERLGADCDDLQYLRELTKNSLEADATTDRVGRRLAALRAPAASTSSAASTTVAG